MMRKRKYTIPVVVLALVLVVSALALANLKPGTKAPDFKLPNLEGKQVKLSSYFAKSGNVVVLDVWATWCPYCVGEVPQLIKLQSDYKKKPVKVIGVAIDDQLAPVKEFAKNNKINYTLLYDQSGKIMHQSYDVQGIPATYIIDKKGVIKFVHSGFPADPKGQKETMDQMRKQIDSLLK